MKRLIAAISVTAFAVAAAVWWRSGEPKKLINASNAIRETPSHKPARGSPLPEPVVSVSSESDISDRSDVVKMRRMIEAHNVPINFWGKVIDQDGVSLPGVQVAYTYSIYHGNDQGVAWIDLETGKGETTSDGQGLFAITDLRGHDLTIESLTKWGYLRRERHQLIYNFYGDMPEKKFEPRRDQPVSVTMIAESATESLIHVKGGLSVRGDGTAERWNLWTGEPDANGELAVALTREPAVIERQDQVATWTADLEVIGGGIIKAPWNEEVRRAPESGYFSKVPYSKEPQKEGVGVRSFYLRTADGKYGRIQVQLYPGDDGPAARCFITGDMNPRPGSRNLEPSEDE